METLTKRQQELALKIVAGWLGPRLGHNGPAPVGPDAAYTADGPMLVSDWDWPSEPTPTILLEGGPYDWAIEVSCDDVVCQQMRKIGVYAEPYAGYALCLYRES